jgi:23S rRNA (uracil1939-C5)-methyltransferase
VSKEAKPKSKLVVGDRLELETLRLARGGKAVGRTSDGQVVFVVGAAPNESVRAVVTAVSSRFIEAKMTEIVTPSATRVAAPCLVVDECGGCPWQHVAYDEQVRQKDAILRDTMKRGRAFDDEEMTKFAEFVPSELQFHYRSRVTLRARPKGGTYELGYHKRESHTFVPIPDCLIADAKLVPFAREYVGKQVSKNLKVRDRFQVGVSDSGVLSVGGAFTQVNRSQNSILQKLVSDHVVAHAMEKRQILHWHLLDLYSGNGNLMFPVIEALRTARPQGVVEATGVEMAEASVADASKNPRAQQCSFNIESVDQWLARQKAGAVSLLTKKGLPLDEILILDPPRDGVGQTVMPLIARRKPSLIVYVSCDPATLARDLVRFREATDKQKTKYEVVEARGLDMFPQTDHIEALVVLRRKIN